MPWPAFSREYEMSNDRLKAKILFLLIGISFLGISGISKASESREGTKVTLSPGEVADLRQWVENAKHELGILEDETRRGRLEQRRERYVREFAAIVSRSASKENELLMRYVLNRALFVDELIGRDPAPSELQSLVAFLDSTIDLAKKFYADDQRYLDAIGRGQSANFETPMPVFAYRYADLILRFSRTFIRPAFEYQITFAALGWLANDLNSPRNLDRIRFSEAITRISRLQSRFPEIPTGADSSQLEAIREFKWEYRERVLKHLVDTVAEIKEAEALARRIAEEEKRLAQLSLEEQAKERERQERILARKNKGAPPQGSLISSLEKTSELYQKIRRYENSAEDVAKGLAAAKKLAQTHHFTLEEAVDFYVEILKTFGGSQTQEALSLYDLLQDKYLSIADKRESDVADLFKAVKVIRDSENGEAEVHKVFSGLRDVYKKSEMLILPVAKEIARLNKQLGNGGETAIVISILQNAEALLDRSIPLPSIVDCLITLSSLENGINDVATGFDAIRSAVFNKGVKFDEAALAYQKLLRSAGSGETAAAITQYNQLVDAYRKP